MCVIKYDYGRNKFVNACVCVCLEFNALEPLLDKCYSIESSKYEKSTAKRQQQTHAREACSCHSFQYARMT